MKRICACIIFCAFFAMGSVNAQHRIFIGNEAGNNFTVAFLDWRGYEYKRIIVPMAGKPYDIQVADNKVFVACAAGPSGQSAIALFDLNTLAFIKAFPINGKPFGIAVTKDGKKLFATNQTENTVWYWDIPTGKQTTVQLKAPFAEWAVMFCKLSPDEKALYVTGQGNHLLYKIDTATGNLLAALPLPSPRGMVMFKNKLFVANEKPVPGVTIVDMDTFKVTHKMELNPINGGAFTLDINPSGDTLYVAQAFSPLIALNAETLAVKWLAPMDDSLYHYGAFCIGLNTAGITSQAERGKYPSSVKIYKIINGKLEMITYIPTSGGMPYLVYVLPMRVPRILIR